MPPKLLNKLLVGISIGAVVYFLFILYADYSLFLRALETFSWKLIPVLLLLSLANYYLRFLRWHYYLYKIEIKLPWLESHLVFFSGLVMSITPGKLGEILKPYLINKITGDSVAKTIPVVLVERLLDFLGLVMIALFSLFFVKYSSYTLAVVGVLLILVILLPGNKKFSEFMFSLLGRISPLRKHMEKIRESHDSIQKMVSPKPLSIMILISIVSWFFECFSLYLVLEVFNPQITVMWSSFIYAFSTVAGALSFFPGGLGITEGSLTFLISDAGFSTDIAILATFIIRVATLWFAIFIGAISLFLLQKRIGKIKST
ncbi:MAG: flippase-like domain-containing protein [Bacteroidetes bacterium]|nr:flippase-like domain-containing protein [Bacteroidota bacterium]